MGPLLFFEGAVRFSSNSSRAVFEEHPENPTKNTRTEAPRCAGQSLWMIRLKSQLRAAILPQILSQRWEKLEQVRHSIEVQVYRGQVLESHHQVEACVLFGQDSRTFVFGNPARMTFPRSTFKLVQAMPLVELFENKLLNTEELAISCASHRGEASQMKVLEAWQKKSQVNPQHLVCGFHLPAGEKDIEKFFSDKSSRSSLFNNCAGKHLGFSHWSVFKGIDPRGYQDLNHPAQQQLLANIKRLGLDRELQFGVDGCGVPNFAMSLQELTQILQGWMKSPEGKTLTAAMRAHPHLVSGESGLDTWIIRNSQGAVLSKGGAEGLAVALLPEAGIVVAVKALDGAARAAQAATLALLNALPETPKSLSDKLVARLSEPILNWAGESTGQIRVQGVAL